VLLDVRIVLHLPDQARRRIGHAEPQQRLADHRGPVVEVDDVARFRLGPPAAWCARAMVSAAATASPRRRRMNSIGSPLKVRSAAMPSGAKRMVTTRRLRSRAGRMLLPVPMTKGAGGRRRGPAGAEEALGDRLLVSALLIAVCGFQSCCMSSKITTAGLPSRIARMT